MENINSTVTKEMIVEGLKNLGLKTGDIVMVHSSLKSFGYVVGGVDTIIDALLETVGEQGTVVVPTLTGSDKLSPENPPVFDVKNTPCWTGKIPEVFRKRKEAIRSLHPTHSVAAIGALAKFLTENHERCITPCGKGSPYYKLAQMKGYVLLLGVDLRCCTLLHTVEELADLPYHMQKDWVFAKVIDERGKEQEVKVKIHLYGYERDFLKMEPLLLKEEAMKLGTIGKSSIRLIKADKLIKIALKQIKKDPNFLLKT